MIGYREADQNLSESGRILHHFPWIFSPNDERRKAKSAARRRKSSLRHNGRAQRSLDLEART